MDPLEKARKLREKIGEALLEIGLEIGEDVTWTLNDVQDTLSFNLTILPGAVIQASDFDQQEYDRIFLEITDQL